MLESGHPHIFTHLRPHPLGNVICAYNFSELPQTLPVDFCYYQRVFSPYDLITRRTVHARDKLVHLAPYDRLWIVEALHNSRPLGMLASGILTQLDIG